MNEFIVWDKDRKVWIDESYPFYVNSVGLLCIQRNDKVMQIETDCEIFKPIGKTDINGEKIYADSSIVEFTYYDKYNNTHKCIGYFTYDDDSLAYYVVFESKTIKGYVLFISSDIQLLKIVGTIQENKELLESEEFKFDKNNILTIE